MKRRVFVFGLTVLLASLLCACGNRGSLGVIGGADGPTAVLVSGGLKDLFRHGNVKHVTVESPGSDIYSEIELDAAIEAAKDYFHDHFGGCTMTEIAYVGDSRNADYAERAEWYGMDEIAVLTSVFDVDKRGGDRSLKPNGHYSGWLWIMGRKAGGGWAHLDHGY